MADNTKAQKLASARKKFKELKKEKKKIAAQKPNENGESTATSREQTPIDNTINSYTIPEQSAIPEQNAIPEPSAILQLPEQTSSIDSILGGQQQVPPEQSTSPLPNYFSNSNINSGFVNHHSNYENGYQQPAVFFDQFSHPSNDSSLHNVLEDQHGTPSSYFGGGSTTNYFYVNSEPTTGSSGGFQQLDNPQDGAANFFDHQSGASSTSPIKNEIISDNNDYGTSMLGDTTSADNSYTNLMYNSASLANDSSSSTLLEPQILADVEVKSSLAVDGDSSRELSSVESLKQLQDEIADLIRPNQEQTSHRESNLELRNQELAALLTQEKIRNGQLNANLQDHQLKLNQLQAELKEKELSNNNVKEQEIARLKEDLQAHVQTVGILVGEKTELSAELSQTQLALKVKTSECEELQNRLKTSRSRVAELERELNVLKSEQSQHDNVGKGYLAELERLKNDYHLLKEHNEELMQDLSEAREKLKTTNDSNSELQQQLNDLSGQLALAHIKIQQLTVTGQDQINDQVDKLMQEKFALEKRIADLDATLKSVTKDRDESGLQYQQYAQQLNAQLGSLAERLERLQKENETLVLQEQSRIKHIGDLEKQLQNVQSTQVSYAVQRTNGEIAAELATSREAVLKLQVENNELIEENSRIAQEKTELSNELARRKEAASRLKELVEQLRSSQPDSAKLLAAMESDKVAASRAVSQNADMKRQMESMQEVFMKLNDDKVELTETLTAEQRSNKDLFEKLQKTELHLQTLADAIEIKDKELSHLREETERLTKQMLQTEQLTDRLRHYEAQDHGSHSLQTELQEAQQTVARLTQELDQLRRNDANRAEIARSESDNEARETIARLTDELDQIKRNKAIVIRSEPETTRIDPAVVSQETQNRPQLVVDADNSEIAELRQKLSQLELRNKELETTVQNLSNSNPNDLISPSKTDLQSHDSNWNVLDKESAMKHLEQKFLRTMDDIATLTEEKQRLEHLVLQLQSETETIGEYVALYQHQRSVLKQRAIEKDQQLIQLENDRLQIKSKLDKLNELVNKLVIEKGSIPPELLQHHDRFNRESQELCEEHAKLHSQINKITERSLKANMGSAAGDNVDTSLSTETAEEIIALLSEIKTSNLVQPSEMIHHCPWCSGQLITV